VGVEEDQWEWKEQRYFDRVWSALLRRSVEITDREMRIKYRSFHEKCNRKKGERYRGLIVTGPYEPDSIAQQTSDHGPF